MKIDRATWHESMVMGNDGCWWLFVHLNRDEHLSHRRRSLAGIPVYGVDGQNGLLPSIHPFYKVRGGKVMVAQCLFWAIFVGTLFDCCWGDHEVE